MAEFQYTTPPPKDDKHNAKSLSRQHRSTSLSLWQRWQEFVNTHLLPNQLHQTPTGTEFWSDVDNFGSLNFSGYHFGSLGRYLNPTRGEAKQIKQFVKRTVIQSGSDDNAGDESEVAIPEAQLADIGNSYEERFYFCFSFPK